MKTVSKLNKWANSHTNVPTNVLRILFGIIVFYKGLFFIEFTNYIIDLLRPLSRDLAILFISNFVLLAHFAGGLLITLGFLTRISVLIQIPILIGAIILNITILTNIIELIQAITLLITALFFLFYGSGKNSLDYSLQLRI